MNNRGGYIEIIKNKNEERKNRAFVNDIEMHWPYKIGEPQSRGMKTK